MAASRLKADNGISGPSKIRYSSVTGRSVGQSAAMPIGEAIKVQPIAADIYADNAAM